MTIALVDIGGTHIKFGLWQDQHVTDHESIKTPDTIEDFYQVITEQITKYRQHQTIEGIGVSAPGSVDQGTGIIHGASAVPYIHNFEIVLALSSRLGIPVSIENDANCAGLAESKLGAGKDTGDAVFLVIGSGVGGAVILQGKVRHGIHLLGGEFGYMLAQADKTVSNLGSPVTMAERFNKREQPKNLLTGKDIFEMAQAGDPKAQAYSNQLYQTLARTIFNLQYSIDPQVFIIGGAISNNPQLIPGINRALDDIMATVTIAEVRPQVKLCYFKADANLVGAAINYQQTIQGEK